MKIIESHDVLESFNMQELTVDDLFEVTGGFCFLKCECRSGRTTPCSCKTRDSSPDPCPCNGPGYNPGKPPVCPRDNSC